MRVSDVRYYVPELSYRFNPTCQTVSASVVIITAATAENKIGRAHV